ncbi:unnamed protein product [Trifolium pratense]|uniref:Uncharacterized protein n=1 Tax=Trifolium pratense TaxID=57577 RepID=A0ACB0ME99_TRIPR|nr:unnamed protein product [Trifolium pratense]
MKDSRFICKIRYGGCFSNKNNLDYVGKETEWNCDSDRWSYWELTSILEDKGVNSAHILGMWYNDPREVLGLGLRDIKDDKGAFDMIKIAQQHGTVDVFVDNGPNYVLGPSKNQEEVIDNGHYEIVRESSPVVGLENDNDVHSEIFGQGYYSENDNESGGGGDDESESRDSARKIIFDDSEEESDAHGGLEEENPPPPPSQLVPVANFRKRNVDSTSTVHHKEKKRKEDQRRIRVKWLYMSFIMRNLLMVLCMMREMQPKK